MSAHSAGGQTGTDAASAAVASIQVTTGAIHLSSYAMSQVTQGPAMAWNDASAWGHFSDSFVLAAAGVAPGTPAYLTVAFGVSGSLGTTGVGEGEGLGRNATSNWRASIELTAAAMTASPGKAISGCSAMPTTR